MGVKGRVGGVKGLRVGRLEVVGVKWGRGW